MIYPAEMAKYYYKGGEIMIGSILLLIKGGGTKNCTACPFVVARFEKYCAHCGGENPDFNPGNIFSPDFEGYKEKWCREDRHEGLKECIAKENFLVKLLTVFPFNYCPACGVRVRD